MPWLVEVRGLVPSVGLFFFVVVESVIGHQSSSSLWILVGVFAIRCNFSGKVPHV